MVADLPKLVDLQNPLEPVMFNSIVNMLPTSFEEINTYQLARKIYSKIRPKSKPMSHKKDLGEVYHFENVPVTPYQYLLKVGVVPKGGPIWPDWSNQLEARHCRNLTPIDDCPEHPQRICYHFNEPAAWCGGIVKHFGHQIADFSTRILHTRSAHPKVKLLFSTWEDWGQYKTFNKTPAFFRAILDWYNIGPDDIEIIMEPTLVRELMVAPQAEQLYNYGPSSEYLDLIDEHVEQRLRRKPKQRAIFVSRAGTSVHFAGEAYIENLMQEAGIKVIRPETMPLEEQLAEYEASEQLIFTEGSALHSLQLLGRAIDHIHVLVRRPGCRIAENLLNVRAKSLSYIEVAQGVVCALYPNGDPQHGTGIPIYNEDAIINYLRSIDQALSDRWNQSLYLELRDNDILAWLEWIATKQRTKITPSKEAIITSLRKLDLSHLVPFAETCLPAFLPNTST